MTVPRAPDRPPTSAGCGRSTRTSRSRRPNLFAVADGMGGHVGGEVAAQVAVDALLQVFTREPTRAGLRRRLHQGQSGRMAGEPGPQRTARHGDHADRGGPGGRRRRAGHAGAGQRGRLAGLPLLGRSDRAGHGRPQPGRGAHAPRRDDRGGSGGAPAAPHPHPGARDRLRGGDRHVGAAAPLRATASFSAATGSPTSSPTTRWPRCWRRVPDPGEAAHQLVEIANEHGGSDNITVIVVDVLVGEDTPAHASVITPLGARAGSAPRRRAGVRSGGAAGPNGGSRRRDGRPAGVRRLRPGNAVGLRRPERIVAR